MRELGRRAGVDVGTISRLESGHVPRPNLTTSAALARALGIHPADLANTPDPDGPERDRGEE